MWQARRTIVSLFAGTVVTCLVAAIASLQANPRPIVGLPPSPTGTASVASIELFSAIGLSAVPDAPLPDMSALATAWPVGPFTISAGWPARAFSATTDPRERSPRGGLSPAELPFGGLAARPVTSPHFLPRVLPYTPIWSGVILDTALFGSASYLLLAACHSLRGRMRLRRGVCPNCLYRFGPCPSRCTECGHPLTVG